MVIAVLPTVAEFGEIELSVGAGLFTVKFEEDEVPPPAPDS
jgi:hypothetical protein